MLSLNMLLRKTIIRKIGLDIHGTIDAFPKEFSKLSNELINIGWQVHIITGRIWQPDIVSSLEKMNIKWTHQFSISDYLLSQNEKVIWKKDDNPIFDEEKWNKTKAEYCKKEEITIHIDDSKVYGKYFETPYFLISDDIVVDEDIFGYYNYHIRGIHKNHPGFYKSFCGTDLLGKSLNIKTWNSICLREVFSRGKFCFTCNLFLSLLKKKDLEQ